MQFKNWLEATVSSENLAEALQKTLEMTVEGNWHFDFPKDITRGDNVKITGKLQNHKTIGNAYFFLSSYAIKNQPLFNYDSSQGGDNLSITAMLLYFDGKGGYKKLGERNRELNDQNPKTPYGYILKSPFSLANWVNYVIADFKGFDDNDNDDEPQPEPEWKPTPGSKKLVGV